MQREFGRIHYSPNSGTCKCRCDQGSCGCGGQWVCWKRASRTATIVMIKVVSPPIMSRFVSQDNGSSAARRISRLRSWRQSGHKECLQLFLAQPGLRSADDGNTNEAAHVQALAVRGRRDLATINLAILGIENLTPGPGIAILLQSPQDGHADNGLVLVITLEWQDLSLQD